MAKEKPQTSKISLSALDPGGAQKITLDKHRVNFRIPANEGLSFGSLLIDILDLEINYTLERDGSPETAWIQDINKDKKSDLVIVIRCTGSGSFTSTFLLLSQADSYQLITLPALPEIQGYMGHETISLKGGIIRCSFPTYINHEELRRDKQWKLKDATKAKPPLKHESDTNASPSGGDIQLHFDYAENKWIKDL